MADDNLSWQLDNLVGRWRAGSLVVLVLASTALMPAASAGAAVPVVVVSGRGFGHGVGMAQDGALTMGVDGASTEQILGQFYPGTTIGRGRGQVRVPVLSTGAEAAVNHLDVEDYLRGMGEVRDSRWPAASLQAQAVAARSYALRAMAAGGEICASQRCQVYLSDDPDPWEVSAALPELADPLGYPGGLRSVVVSETGPSGRATEVELHGPAGTRAVPARRFATALGLRSSLWSLEVTDAATAPPPPPQGNHLQALPDGLDVGSSDAAASGPLGPAETAPGRGLDDPVATIATTPATAASWLLLGLFPVGVVMRRRAGRRHRTG